MVEGPEPHLLSGWAVQGAAPSLPWIGVSSYRLTVQPSPDHPSRLHTGAATPREPSLTAPAVAMLLTAQHTISLPQVPALPAASGECHGQGSDSLIWTLGSVMRTGGAYPV